MSLAEESLQFLVCPDDRSPLVRAERPLVERLNAALAAGGLVNRVGKKLPHRAVQGALVRADGTIAYPVVDEIPVLVVDEGIPLAQLELAP